MSSKNWPANWGPRPPHVTCVRGKPQFQLRRGAPRVVIQADPASDPRGFLEAYKRTEAEARLGQLVVRGGGRKPEDKVRHLNRYEQTVGHLVTLYKQSTAYKRLGSSTATATARYLDTVLQTKVRGSDVPFKDMPVAGLRAPHAYALRDALPPAAKQPLGHDHAYRDMHMKVMRTLFHWAPLEGGIEWVVGNPFARLKPLHPKPKLNYAWAEADFERMYEHFPLGTQQHLAVMLCQFLMVRVSDLAHLGAANFDGRRYAGLTWSRMVDGEGGTKRLEWLESKNHGSRAKPGDKERSLVIHPLLLETIRKTPGALGRPTFLISRRRGPYSVKSIGDMFNRWCIEAGQPNHVRAHGIRRAGAAVAKMRGVSTGGLQGLGGWNRPETAEVYAQQANLRALADDAVMKLGTARQIKEQMKRRAA